MFCYVRVLNEPSTLSRTSKILPRNIGFVAGVVSQVIQDRAFTPNSFPLRNDVISLPSKNQSALFKEKSS